jgi:hypothetical protein
MFLDLNRTGECEQPKMFLELSCDGMRLRVYLEVSELRQHIERNDLSRQSLCNEIDAPRSIAEEA